MDQRGIHVVDAGPQPEQFFGDRVAHGAQISGSSASDQPQQPLRDRIVEVALDARRRTGQRAPPTAGPGQRRRSAGPGRAARAARRSTRRRIRQHVQIGVGHRRSRGSSARPSSWAASTSRVTSSVRNGWAHAASPQSMIKVRPSRPEDVAVVQVAVLDGRRHGCRPARAAAATSGPRAPGSRARSASSRAPSRNRRVQPAAIGDHLVEPLDQRLRSEVGHADGRADPAQPPPAAGRRTRRARPTSSR